MNAAARLLPSDSRIDDDAMDSLLSLRRSLDGSWALLFSHANDFAAQGFEADRWLAHVRAAFETTEIRPIALAGDPSDRGSTWIAELGGLTKHVCIDAIRRSALAYEALVDARAPSYVDIGRRYVLLLDEAARLRWSFRYDPGTSLPSPIELAAFAETKRCEHLQPVPSRLARDRNRRMHLVSDASAIRRAS